MAEHKGGKQPRYKNPEDLERAINEYFSKCNEIEYMYDADGQPVLYKGEPVILKKPEPYTMAGLALYIGFNSRSSLDDYMKKGVSADSEHVNEDKRLAEELKADAFRKVILRARAEIEAFRERSLFDKNTFNGAKFALACNGWSDKQTLDINVKSVSEIASPADAVAALEALGFQKTEDTNKKTEKK